MTIIIKNDRVQLVAEAGAAVQHEKALRVVEEDGVARAFELTCSCGDVTVIELEYSSPEAEAVPAPAPPAATPSVPEDTRDESTPQPQDAPPAPSTAAQSVAAYVEGSPAGQERRRTQGN